MTAASARPGSRPRSGPRPRAFSPPWTISEAGYVRSRLARGPARPGRLGSRRLSLQRGRASAPMPPAGSRTSGSLRQGDRR
ncbi:MAG: hypothetical protein MZU95_01620 [Desulfomicrobium escambiense]|nr:hypothetical protein [Desulfomicrobium escambiense]